MAAEPIKLSILKALSSHLEGIVGPDWGDFDLRNRVFRGRARFGEEMGRDPFVSIIEAPRPDTGREVGENGSSRAYEWPLLLQAWVGGGEEHLTDTVYYLQQEIECRLAMIISVTSGSGLPSYPGVYMLGGLVTHFSFGPGVVRQPTEGVSSTAFLYCPLRVGIATIG